QPSWRGERGSVREKRCALSARPFRGSRMLRRAGGARLNMSRPGSARPFTSLRRLNLKIVDARHEAGHDGVSHLDLLLIDHAPDRWTLQHPALERRVMSKLAHRQPAADAPGLEDEPTRIEHGVLGREPFAARQHLIDLGRISEEGP